MDETTCEMTQELVSVIMPTFNEAHYLAESIECVLGQTYAHLELLITDDGSTNREVSEMLRRYAERDARVRIFFLDENRGAGYARNNSIAEARGRYIAFCDSDDRWIPDKLERQVAFMKERGACLSYTSYFLCDADGEVRGVVRAPKRMTFARLKRDNKIGCLTAMYDVKVCGKMYMPTIRKRQDWGLFLLILKEHGVAYGMSEPLAYYRKRRGSMSAKKYTLVKHNALMYMKVLGYSPLKARLYVWLVFMPTYLVKKVCIGLRNLLGRPHPNPLQGEGT